MKNSITTNYLCGIAKKLFLTMFLCFTFFAGFSQASYFGNMKAFDEKITAQISKNNFTAALNLVDTLSKNNDFLPSYSKYYYKGFIFKEKYKKNHSNNDYDSCLFYMSKAKLSAKITGLSINDESKTVLKFILILNHNSASAALDKFQIDSAEYYYSNFKKTLLIMDSLSPSSTDIEFNCAIGSTCYRFYEQNKKANNSFADKGFQYFKQILQVDSNNYTANYNTMIYYFNQAVENLGKGEYCKQVEIANTVDWSNPNTQIPSIEKLLECVKPQEYEKYNVSPPMRKALPYALKTYQLAPKNKNVLTALFGIYYTTGSEANALIYRKKLDDLRNGN